MNQKSREQKPDKSKSGLTVKTGVKGGIGGPNHSRQVLRAKAGLAVKSGIKGGVGGMNHSRQLLRF